MDLDLSAALLGQDNHVIEVVDYRQLASSDGSVTHSGDSRGGEGEGGMVFDFFFFDFLDFPPLAYLLEFRVCLGGTERRWGM